MISLTLEEIAAIVGGRVAGDATTMVSGPAVLDGRRAEPGGLFVAFAGAQVDGHDYAGQAARAGAVAVLGSRATSLPTVVVADAQAALQRLAAHVVARLRDGLTVVGVTGSQGKTSTKDLLRAALAPIAPTVATLGNLNNQLGVPITMLRADASTRHLVLELGARRIGDIAHLTELVAPDVGVVLNVGKAHIGEFGSQDAIAAGKGELVEGLAPSGVAILNADDPRVVGMRSRTRGEVVTFGCGSDADVRVLDLSLDGVGRPSFTLVAGSAAARVALPLVGAHQAVNAAAAAAVAQRLGATLEDAARSLADVSHSGQRLEVRRLPVGATLLNDSYNSSPGSARSSLDALATVDGRRRIAVLGAILELGDHSETEHRLVGEYASSRADIVIAVGEEASPIGLGAGSCGIALRDNAAAIDWLRRHLSAGDVVLVKASRGARLDEVADALTDVGPAGIEPTTSTV